jgi:hypothetical protein
MPRLLPLLLLATLTPTLQAQTPTSGFYGGHTLQLVASPDGSFTASFFDQTGAGQFTCGFLLHAHPQPAAHGTFNIVTWWPYHQLHGTGDNEVVRGTLRLSDTGLTLQLPAQAHGGCWNVNGDLDQGKPVDLDRDSPDPKAPAVQTWQALRVITTERVSLRPQPEASAPTRPYLVRGNVILVTASQGPWLHVAYYSYNTGNTFTGWLQESDLLPNTIP